MPNASIIPKNLRSPELVRQRLAEIDEEQEMLKGILRVLRRQKRRADKVPSPSRDSEGSDHA